MESRAAYRDSLVLSITHQLLRATGYARARDGLLSNVSRTLDALRAIELSEQGSAPETPHKTELWRRITERLPRITLAPIVLRTRPAASAFRGAPYLPSVRFSPACRRMCVHRVTLCLCGHEDEHEEHLTAVALSLIHI